MPDRHANIALNVQAMTVTELQQRAADGSISGTEWEAVTRELANRKRASVSAPAPVTAPPRYEPPAPTVQRVVVTDFDMPFLSMVNFILKWTLAAIPAMLILCLLALVVVAAFASVRGAGL